MISNLYPFSTKDASAIPLDILRPKSVARIDFLDAVPSAALDLVVYTPVIILRASAPCVISFGAAPTALSAALVANQMYMDAGELQVIAPPASTLYVMGDGVAGSLVVQMIEKWAGLGLDAQFTQI